MPGNSLLFKPWPEYQTKSSLFKPSVTQPISQTPHDLNNERIVRYSGHGLNTEPFDERTVLDHLNTKLVRYSDPHCTNYLLSVKLRKCCQHCIFWYYFDIFSGLPISASNILCEHDSNLLHFYSTLKEQICWEEMRMDQKNLWRPCALCFGGKKLQKQI